MSYMHIPQLYKAQEILLFREVYALEKIHGSSAHVKYHNGVLTFFAGGEKQERFEALFNTEDLQTKFADMGVAEITVFGEVYGGKCQGMSATYGKDLKFVAFEVKIGESWLCVPNAEEVVLKLGLEFVHYKRIPTTLEAIDAERDADSEQAIRNGIGPGRRREGIVLRPPIEVAKNNGSRIIAKHKNEPYSETKSPRDVGTELTVLTEAEAIATEWVTYNRVNHVMQAMGGEPDIERTGEFVKAMLEDVTREGAGEFVDSKPARKAISRRAAEMYKSRLKQGLYIQGEVGTEENP